MPTCIQMVMYKLSIPLIPAEEIGHELGLVVRPEDGYLFYEARTSTTPPIAGYGTRIYEPEFELNTAFERMGVPLRYSIKPIQELSNANELTDELKKSEATDSNALLCFNHGALVDDPSRDWGHVVVFDRIIDGKLRIIDPSPTHPKWRLIEPDKMFSAMEKHGEKKTASGIWTLSKTK